MPDISLPLHRLLPTGVISFLFTDIEGSTKLLERLGERYATVVAESSDILRAHAERCGGVEVDTQGDAFFFAFPHVQQAVRFACDSQRALTGHSWPDGVSVKIRMGIHTGEAVVSRGGYIGMDVHRAARIAASAHGCQVVLSPATRELLGTESPGGVAVRDLGEYKLKDVGTTQIFQLDVDGLPTEFPPLKTLDAKEEPPAPGEPPFLGLHYFDEEHADLFFGREAVTARLVQRLGDEKFLAVIGASGSGKSSIVRAGLIPRLRRGDAGNAGGHGEVWQIYTVRPTAQPLDALASELTRGSESVTMAAKLADDLREHPHSLSLFLTQHVLTRTPHVLVLVDQFEELFTLCRDEEERHAFVRNLLDAANTGAATVVVTIRADFYAALAEYGELREAVAQHQEYIGPMSAEELRSSIEEPAKRNRWDFDAGLVNLILHEVGGEPGALPLLSHALLETWKRRSGTRLILRGYLEAGGVRGAIAKTADRVYTGELSPTQQATARNIFLRLTELGEGTQDTRRRAPLNELIPRAQYAEAQQVREVLQQLADARLITLDEGTAEVAHEALIREWPQLREWLTEDREGLTLHRHLTHAAREWDLLERDPDTLYRGTRLLQALEWTAANPGALNEAEREFLDASVVDAERAEQAREAARLRELEQARNLANAERQRAEAERFRAEEAGASSRRLRQRALFLVGAFGLALLAAAAALFFLTQSNANLQRATEERDAAERSSRVATARELAANSLANLTIDPQRSVLLALQAVRTTQGPDKIVLAEAEDMLHRALVTSRAQMTLGPIETGFQRAVYSPDGTQIATRADGFVLGWDAVSGKELWRTAIGGGAVDNLAYSSDGAQLATWDFDPNDFSYMWVKIFDAHSGELVRETKLAQSGKEWNYGFYNSDLSRIVEASLDKTAKVWDTRTGQLLMTLGGHGDTVTSAQYSPDETRIVTGSSDRSAKVWDAETGKEIVSLCCQSQEITWAVYSPDAKKIATASTDGLVKLWDADGGKELLTLAGHTAQVYSVTFSPDGSQVAAPSWDRTTIVWDSESGKEMYRLAGQSDFVMDANYSPDGKHLVTASSDKTAVIWDTLPSHEVAGIAGSPIYQSAVSADRRRLVTRQAGGRFTVWDMVKLEPLFTLNDPGADPRGVYAGVAISPDGARIAFYADKVVKIWEVDSGKQLLTLTPEKEGISPSFIDRPAFSADGKRIAAVSLYNQDFPLYQKQVTIWDAQSGTKLADFADAKELADFGPIAFSPDGTRVVVGNAAGVARTFDAQTGAQLAEYHEAVRRIPSIAFSPDGRQLATSLADGSVAVSDPAKGSVLFSLVGHNSSVWNVEYSTDGKYIATASWDGTAKVWDASNGKELHTLYASPGQVRGAHITADGKRLVTTSVDGSVREYALGLDDLVAQANARLTRGLTQEECSKYLHQEQCPLH